MTSENNKNFIGQEANDSPFSSQDTLKGKNALDILHQSIVRENEMGINLKISDIYGVDYDEAYEIHVNYHNLRIKNLIEKTGILANSKKLINDYFDIKNLSSKVASGEITENTCVDILIKFVKNRSETKVKDRYINFYG